MLSNFSCPLTKASDIILFVSSLKKVMQKTDAVLEMVNVNNNLTYTV